MNCDFDKVIDKYYPAGSRRRDIYMKHCRQVADKALAIARRKGLALDDDDIIAGAMLHDIGIALTDAPGIDCHGTAPYVDHGPLGATLLRSEGAPESWARVAERHTGSGIGTLVPETLLERLICYADKFYSKSGTMLRKSPDSISRSLSRFGPESLARWQSLLHEFE